MPNDVNVYQCALCGVRVSHRPHLSLARDGLRWSCTNIIDCRQRIYNQLQALRQMDTASRSTSRIILRGNAYGGVWFWDDRSNMIDTRSQSSDGAISGRFIPDDRDVL